MEEMEKKIDELKKVVTALVQLALEIVKLVGLTVVSIWTVIGLILLAL